MLAHQDFKVRSSLGITFSCFALVLFELQVLSWKLVEVQMVRGFAKRVARCKKNKELVCAQGRDMEGGRAVR